MNIAIIPARGGSTRIPRKNIKLFHGKPIIAYSIEIAKKSGLFDSVIVSTEDDEIRQVAQKYGADVMIRPRPFTDDQYGPLDVARYHLAELVPDSALICVLYATAPLMSVEDLTRGYREMGRSVAYAVSIGVEPLHDAAQFFWCRPRALREHAPEFGERTVMVPIAKERDCDINTPMDWARAELMYQELKGAGKC